MKIEIIILLFLTIVGRQSAAQKAHFGRYEIIGMHPQYREFRPDGSILFIGCYPQKGSYKILANNELLISENLPNSKQCIQIILSEEPSDSLRIRLKILDAGDSSQFADLWVTLKKSNQLIFKDSEGNFSMTLPKLKRREFLEISRFIFDNYHKRRIRNPINLAIPTSCTSITGTIWLDVDKTRRDQKYKIIEWTDSIIRLKQLKDIKSFKWEWTYKRITQE